MEALQSSFGDAFVSLPILIIGLIFFLGMLTSNVGLLYLFLGHLAVVPSLSFLSNEKDVPWADTDKTATPPTVTRNPVKAFQWILSLIILFTIAIYSAVVSAGGAGAAVTAGIIGIIPQFFGLPFFFMNPIPSLKALWNRKLPSDTEFSGGADCSIFPRVENPYNSPSQWVSHMTFFFGFIMANAAAVYQEPTPKTSATSDPVADKKRQASINLRVSNRKSITASIIIISLIIFFTLLYFRYGKTACEERFSVAWFPILVIYLMGAAFFNLVYKTCGVRPADVLGIVQGMISTDLINNPIVCVGTPQ